MRFTVDPHVAHLGAWIADKGRGLNCDYQQAKAFLRALDPLAEAFSFRTFSECHYTRQPGFDPLERGIHGSLDECWEELVHLNRRGAAISVTINRTRGRGRAVADVLAVRALFVDDDHAGDRPRRFPLTPQIQVQTSPGRYHHYWLVDGLALEDFSPLQGALARQFDGDHRVAALNQSMQLPGFWRRKNLSQPRLPSLRHILTTAPYNPERIKDNLMGESAWKPSAAIAGEGG